MKYCYSFPDISQFYHVCIMFATGDTKGHACSSMLTKLTLIFKNSSIQIDYFSLCTVVFLDPGKKFDQEGQTPGGGTYLRLGASGWRNT